MFYTTSTNPPYVFSNLIPSFAPHAFTTRLGGVSSGALSSLNLGTARGDREENVKENYRRICAQLGFNSSKLVCFKQIHSANVACVTSDNACAPYNRPLPEGDAAVTNECGITLTVFTADCVPILLCDKSGKAVGAVHAGWRGTVSGIVSEAVRVMALHYGCKSADILAAIGPSIGKCCFETDNDVPKAARSAFGFEAERFIFESKNSGKYLVDLRGINALLLERAGVPAANIDISNECTFCQSDKYWSHRASRGVRGTQAAMIMLRETSRGNI